MPFQIIFDDLRHREVFSGSTPEAAVSAARGVIDQYPEYADMSDSEFAAYIETNDTEFAIEEKN